MIFWLFSNGMIGLLKVRWKYGKLCKALSHFLFPFMIHIKQMSLQKRDAWFRSPRRHPWRHTIETSRLVCAGYPAIDTIGSCVIVDMSAYTFNINTIWCMFIVHSMKIKILMWPNIMLHWFSAKSLFSRLFFFQWFLAPFPHRSTSYGSNQLWQPWEMRLCGTSCPTTEALSRAVVSTFNLCSAWV